MCDKCKQNSCTGGCNSNSIADLQSQLDSVMSSIDTLTSLTKFLSGHPILALQDPSDIVLFDLTTGKGTSTWTGWAICDGTNYQGINGSINTPDLRDRFLVGSQGTYAVGDTGGLNTVTLVVGEMPSHIHGITDPGHTHIIIDPGHDHEIIDPGHTHSGTAAPHIHTFTTDVAGAHTHVYQDATNNPVDVSGITATSVPVILDKTGGPTSVRVGNDNYFDTARTTDSAGVHTHTGTTDTTTVAITVSTSFTGISDEEAFTGISNTPNTTGITVNAEGGDGAHENRPPYIALLFVKKIY